MADHLALDAGIESMRFQYDRTFFPVLVEIITRARAAGVVTTLSPELREITAAIQSVTNIQVDLRIDDNPDINAWVIVPNNRDGHSMLPGRPANPNRIAEMFRGEAKKYLTAGVNFEKGFVFGAFTKLLCPIGITTGMMNSTKCTPAMVAAAIAHEVGHLWAFFAWYKRTVRMNHQLYETVMDFVRAVDKVERLMILRRAEKSAKIVINNIEYIAERGDPALVTTAYMTSEPSSREDANGSWLYQSRTFEAIADQFVTKIGGGVAAVQLQDLMNREYGNAHRRSAISHVAAGVMSVLIGTFKMAILTVATVGYYPIVYAYGFLLDVFADNSGLLYRIYDKPRERMERVRLDMVHSLKQRDVPKPIRDLIVSEIAAVDDIMALVKDRSGPYEAFVLFLSSKRRAERDGIIELQALQTLSNNNFYVQSARLDSLV